MQKVRLGEYIGQIRGVSYKPTDLHKSLNNDSVILLRANNINEGEINFDDVVYVDKSKVKKEQYLKQGDILVCASSGSKELVGKAAFIKKDIPVTFGAFCKLIRPTGCCAEYLGHYFNSQIYRKKISDLALGANINNIRNEHIDELYLNFPNDLAQKRISEVLDKISLLIDKRKKQLKKLDELVKARFVEMFGDGQYPEQPLYKFSEITGGLTKNGKRKSMPLKYKYLRVANVFYNRLDLSDVQEIGVEKAEIPKTLLKKNDLLFVEGNGSIEQVGRVALWNGEINPCLHQNHLIKVRFNSGVAPEYVLFYFMSEAGRHQIKESAVSTTGLHTLSTGKVANLRLPLPPLTLQLEFAAFVEKVDKLALKVKASLDKLETLKQAQMQKYFG